MIYTIKGEQPFQVLNDSFSVSPSESGYDLYISADGFNYSNFATVASGVTRQFTGMNEGNYYILSGNTSEVKVNWMKDCGGGGGGSAAGVSSLDGQTGALTTKTINGNAILGSGDIVISGGTSGPTVIDFDAMTQAEKAAFFAELQPVWSGTSVNGDYVFLKSYNDYTPDGQGTRQFRLQLFNGEGNTLHFGATISTQSQRVATILYDLYSDGSDRKEVGAIQGATEVQSNGYFDNRSDYIIFDETTSALTTTKNSGEALTNGYQFGGSLYWFIAEPYAGSWSYAIPLLGFKIIDSNGGETMHYFPSTSTKSITTTTVDGVDYNKEFTADYGKFTFKMLMNSDPKGANFTVTYNR